LRALALKPRGRQKGRVQSTNCMPLRASMAAVCLVGLAAGCGHRGATRADGGDAGPSTGAAGSAGDGAAGASADEGGASGAAPDAPADAVPTDAAEAFGAEPSATDAPTDAAAEGGADAKDAADASVEAAPPAPGSPYRVLAVSTGILHTCTLLDNHRIKCWGAQAYGELGLGDKRSHGASPSDMGDALPFVDLGAGRTAVALAAGKYHTCAILDDGGVKCWGYTALVGLPADGTGFGHGDEPGEMGDKLPELDFGPGHKARLIGTSSAESCAVFEDGTAQCWGDKSPPTPHPVTLGTAARAVQLGQMAYSVIALFDDGTVANGLSDATLVGGRGVEKAVYIAGSEEQSCVVFEAGSVQCLNMTTAPPDGVMGFQAIGATYDTACGLFTGGDVRCFRSGVACFNQIPGATYWCPAPRLADQSQVVALGQPATAISTGGSYQVCAILADGGLKCWRMQDDCQFDNGTLISCVPPVASMLDPNLGSSVDVVTTGGVRSYGAWREIDLGKHP
jgi:hypothetical protein